ncbi:DUF2470 domain-containing protein [Streptomyces sp. NPDC050418]|uniref:DUF2470 domain-containing protein n=1 Tax=Streptomyces sp. NPDC050418 TaxID=3365612 RepID=UPI0037917E37
MLLVPGAVRAPQELLMPLAREVTSDGDVHLLFPADAPPVRAATHAQADELSAVLEITDVAPVAVPHRIRGRAWLSGWLTRVPEQAEPGRMMLRLEIGEISVDDLWGSGKAEPEAFAAAAADPLAEHEAELLQHLHAAHGDQVRLLGSLLGTRAGLAHTERAVPLALDRFGLRIRFAGEGQCFDARFDFPEPVGNVTELRRAMHQLFTAASE